MHPSISLAEEALKLAEYELVLLDKGDIEEIAATTQKRIQLLDDAWKERTAECTDDLRKRLEIMHGLQKKMMEKAQKLHSSLAEELKDMRRRDVRQKGYRQVCSNPYSDIPVYISRRS